MSRAALIRSLSSCLMACLGLLPMQPGVAQHSTPVVDIEQGSIAGRVESGIEVYRGIPYAAPPVGDLRWRPPQPPRGWAGTREAVRFGYMCPQTPRDSYPDWLKDHFAVVGMN
jgi:para-nitrobenzyl esterase